MAALLRRANHRSGGKRDQSTQEPVPGGGRGRIALLAKGLLLEVPGAFTAVTRMRLKWTKPACSASPASLPYYVEEGEHPRSAGWGGHRGIFCTIRRRGPSGQTCRACLVD